MLQTHPRNEPISRRPFLFPFLFLYFSLLLLLSVLSYKYLIGVRKDATRRRERKRVLSELYLWGAECSHVENEEGTIKRYFNNTSSKLPIMVHARDDRPPRAEKLFHAESSGRDFFFFFSFFLFLRDEGARSYISLVALRVRGFDVSKRPTKLLRPLADFSTTTSRIDEKSRVRLNRVARNSGNETKFFVKPSD